MRLARSINTLVCYPLQTWCVYVIYCYSDQRVLFYRVRDAEHLSRINAETASL
jgi:hypothetical protein